MGYGYSVDLRERVVAFYEQGETTEVETAALFGVGEATVRRWRRRKRETGSLEPKPVAGGNPARVQGDGEILLCELVQDHPDSTIEELTDAFARASGGSISTSSMSRALARLGLTRKKSPSARSSN